MNYRVSLSLVPLLLLFQSYAYGITVPDVVYTTKNAGKVVFSHAKHTTKEGMSKNCRACHDTIFDLKKKKHYSMADMGKMKSCGACHGSKAFGLDKCARCHITKEVLYKVKATGPVKFSHKYHLTKTADCGTCHPSLFTAGANKRYSMADMEKGKSCGACHDSKQAFSVKECAKCHPTRDVLFEEKSTGNVLFSHKSHLGLYTCVDCHISKFSTFRNSKKVSMNEMEAGKSCGSCHEGKTAFSVKEKCDACHKM